MGRSYAHPRGFFVAKICRVDHDNVWYNKTQVRHHFSVTLYSLIDFYMYASYDLPPHNSYICTDAAQSHDVPRSWMLGSRRVEICAHLIKCRYIYKVVEGISNQCRRLVLFLFLREILWLITNKLMIFQTVSTILNGNIESYRIHCWVLFQKR